MVYCDPVFSCITLITDPNDTTNTTDGRACDDGEFCTVNDTCLAGLCDQGDPNVCDDEVACTVETCDEAADTCVHTLCELQKLTADDGAGSDNFGGSVAVSEDVIVIGATGDDDLGGGSVVVSGDKAVIGADGDDHPGFDRGSAYVFEKIGGLWTQVAKLTAADPAEVYWFGESVAISGDTVVIGATPYGAA